MQFSQFSLILVIFFFLLFSDPGVLLGLAGWLAETQPLSPKAVYTDERVSKFLTWSVQLRRQLNCHLNLDPIKFNSNLI